MRLFWTGMTNARDLGGVPLRAGGETSHHRFVRSDHPARLTPEGWRQLTPTAWETDPRGAELFERAMRASGVTACEAIASAVAVVNDAWLAQAGVSIATGEAIRAALAE